MSRTTLILLVLSFSFFGQAAAGGIKAALPSGVKHAASDARFDADRDFVPAIDKAHRLLAKKTAGFYLKSVCSKKVKGRCSKKLVSFNVLLAVQKAGGAIELIRMARDGGNQKGFTIDWEKLNGINTPFMVSKPNGYVVLAIKRVMPVGSVFREVVYTPYIDDLDTPRMRERGMNYIRLTINKAYTSLKEEKVRSSAVSGEFVSDVVPPDVALLLSIIEHIDPSRLRDNDIERLIDEALVTIAANRGNAYRYSVSTAKARGLFQFIPSTYASMARKYPRAHLVPDFVSGMNDHLNAAKASLLLFDSDLSCLPFEERNFVRQKGRKRLLAEYLAASYNGGAGRAVYAYLTGGDWHRRLLPETRWYLVKLNLVGKALKLWSGMP